MNTEASMGTAKSKISAIEDISLNHNIFVVGYNQNGQLCLGHDTDIERLTNWQKYNQDINVKHINNGFLFTIITDNQHKYYVAGRNAEGQCGMGHFNEEIINMEENTFFKKDNINIFHIFSSPNAKHVMYLTHDQKIYSHGLNDRNQCGIDTNEQQVSLPTLINRNTITSSIKHIAIGFDKSFILDIDRNIYWTDSSKKGFDPIGSFQNQNIKIESIAVGSLHALFRTSNGRLFVHGYNEEGQLGMGDTEYIYFDPIENRYFRDNNINIDKIVCGAFHSLISDKQHRIYSFGHNEYGQCGIDNSNQNILTPQIIPLSKEQKFTKIKSGSTHSLIATEKGLYYLFGDNSRNQVTLCIDTRDKINTPFLINNVFNQLTNKSKKIIDIHLGANNTWIITSSKIVGINGTTSTTKPESKEQESYTLSTPPKASNPNFETPLKVTSSTEEKNETQSTTKYHSQHNVEQLISFLKDNDLFNDSKINQFKDKIIGFLRKNTIDGEKLLEISRKEFSDSIVKYCENNKKVRGPANKVWDRYTKYVKSMDKSFHAPPSQANKVPTICNQNTEDKLMQPSITTNTESNEEQKYQSPNPNISGSVDTNTLIRLDAVLILLICIGDYKGGSEMQLPGTQTDKHRLSELFTKQYNYHVITQKSSKVVLKDIKKLLHAAEMEFDSTEIDYKAIIVIYSGHGDAHNLQLSDGTSYSRDKFIKYFISLFNNSLRALKKIFGVSVRAVFEK